MRLTQVLLVLVRAHTSTMGVDHNFGTSLMKRRVNKPVMDRVNPSNRGDNSPQQSRGRGRGCGRSSSRDLISPRPPGVQRLINDNYWLKDPSSLFQDQNQVNSRTLLNCHFYCVNTSYPMDNWPAKRQKKTSCVSTGWPVPVLCTRQMVCRTSFLSRQRDVIASFSFGVCTVYTE